jgi:histone deacetylase 11
VKIVYSPRYNIGFFGLERLHPFDSRKYGRAWRELRRRFGRRLRQWHLRPPRPATRAELSAVHTAEYLDRLRDPAVVARVLELPPLRRLPGWLLDWCVLRPMRWAAAGSVVAARVALAEGLAVNLAGGYHHAKPDGGEGFCAYSDTALIIHQLRTAGELATTDTVAHIDLDAHQGNGVCHQFRDDPRVFLFDMYNGGIYPAFDQAARLRLDCGWPLPLDCDGATYLRTLRQNLPPFLDSLTRSGRLRLAVYNSGTDVYEGGALGGLHLSAADVLERDLFVVAELRERGIPVVMLLSGGYSRESYRLVAATVERLLVLYG